MDKRELNSVPIEMEFGLLLDLVLLVLNQWVGLDWLCETFLGQGPRAPFFLYITFFFSIYADQYKIK